MKSSLKFLDGKIVKMSKLNRILGPTVWVLSYEAKGSHFLGSYPSAQEAEQAAEEEFAHLHRTFDVIGYDARKLDPSLVG